MIPAEGQPAPDAGSGEPADAKARPGTRTRGRARRSATEQAAAGDPPETADLPLVLESLLFVAGEPAELPALARTLGVRVADVERAAAELSERLRGRGLRLQRDNGRLQLVTAPEWSAYVQRFLGVAAEQPLSAAALETLAIIAYRQPVTRAAIEGIRGVGAERAIATLRARGLIEEAGRAEAIGRPVLYRTSLQFLEYFGLEHLGELPPLPAADEA